MGKEILRYKAPIFLEDVDIEKVLASQKDFIWCKNYKSLLVICAMVIKSSH